MRVSLGVRPVLPVSLTQIAICIAVLSLASQIGSTQTSAGPPAPAKVQPGSPAIRAQRLYLQTEAAFILKRDNAKAEQGFLQVVQIDPHYAPAWFNLGVFAESDRSWIKAQTDLRRYLALEPNGPDAKRAEHQLELLRAYAAGTVTPEAATAAEYDAAIQRARNFLAHGYFREAIAEAGRAESLDGSRWEAYAVVSLCMAKQNKTQDAEKFAALAVAHAPPAKRDQVRAVLSSNESAAAK